MTSTVYFAKWILLPSGEFLTNGALVVTGDTITSLGPRSSIKRTSKDRIVNLGKRVLLPGFINMHTHLEDGIMRGALDWDHLTFTSWLRRRVAMVKNASTDELQATVRLGIRESLANGITSLVDTTKRGVAPSILKDEPVRYWTFHEVTMEQEDEEQQLVAELGKRLHAADNGTCPGVAPYALFSLTPKMHKIVNTITSQNQYFWGCHLAESTEELQAFTELSGDLYFHITRKRPWAYGATQRGSTYYAITNNIIPNNAILYHCNYVSSEELSILAAKNASIVLCGHYSQGFGHKPFPMEAALNRGVNICLGTEAPFGLNSMNLFEEIYLMKRHYPHIPIIQMIDWVTKNPARALRCSSTLGSLEEGKKADIIGVRVSSDPQKDLLEELLLEEPQVDFVMVDGEEVIISH